MERRIIQLVVVVAAWLAGVGLADAQEAGRGDSIPAVLQPEYRHRKVHQAEIVAFGGSYLGRTVDSTFLVGGKAYFHISRMFALGASYGFSSPSVGFAEPETHLVNAELTISNDVAMRFGDSVVEADLYLTVGAGALRINGQWEAMGVLGGGLKIYTGLSWLAVRIDVNTYMHRRPLPGSAGFDADIALTPGLAFFFPPDPSPNER